MGNGDGQLPATPGPLVSAGSIFNPPEPRRTAARPACASWRWPLLQDRVDQLVRAYRVRGHMVANIDPLGMPRPHLPELDPEYLRLHAKPTWTGRFRPTRSTVPTCCTLRRHSGAAAQHLLPLDRRAVHAHRRPERAAMAARPHGSDREPPDAQPRRAIAHPDAADRRRRSSRSSSRRSSSGAKSFSLEGAESLIPLLDLAIEKAGEQGIDEIVMGMAHRGRLNVLANIIGKSPREIFREFEDIDPKLHLGRGDVKYHLGYSSDWITAAGQQGAPVAVLQPQPPGIRQPGGAGPHARQAGSRRRRRTRARHGAADPRRRGVRRRRRSCRRRST